MSLQSKDVPWYQERPVNDEVPVALRQLLETYSGFPSDKVMEHIISVREEAWNVFPYPCIGQFAFLNIFLTGTKEYPDILKRLQNGGKLLDLGTCFGQEIRQLVSDGAPAENITGVDVQGEYIELGYKLFDDKASLRATFLTADIFDTSESSPFATLHGSFDIIYAGAFFHLWGYDDQVHVARTVARLLKPEAGSFVAGRQVGSPNPKEVEHKTNPKGVLYQHNVESFQKLWDEVGEELGSVFKVDGELRPMHEGAKKFTSEDAMMFVFVVRRV